MFIPHIGELSDRLQLLSQKGLSPQQIEKVTEMAYRELKLEEMRKRRLRQLEEEDEIFISSRGCKAKSVSNSKTEPVSVPHRTEIIATRSEYHVSSLALGLTRSLHICLNLKCNDLSSNMHTLDPDPNIDPGPDCNILTLTLALTVTNIDPDPDPDPDLDPGPDPSRWP